GGTLNGVTLGGTVGGVPASATVQDNDGILYVTGGLTFANGSLVVVAYGMSLYGDQTLGGDGEIRFRSGGDISAYDGNTTFGPGLTIHRADTGSSVINMVLGTITNQATIRADAGGEIRVTSYNPGTAFTNGAGGVLTAVG